MSSAAAHDTTPAPKMPNITWPTLLVMAMLLALLAVVLQRPTGSMTGRLALEQEGFNLYSYDMKQHHVYAIAIGPRGLGSTERGVWVGKDGSFRIDSLPVGEYELKVHVPGFATSYDSGIFIEDGKTTALRKAIALQLQHPSINIASNRRVFGTKDPPRFWINANGCSEATVTVYKGDMLPMALTKEPVKHIGFEISPDFSIYKPYDSHSKELAQSYFDKKTVVKTWNRKIQEDGEGRHEFQFDQPLPPGDYFAIAEGSNIQKKTDWNVLWFSVSDLGLVVKQDPIKTLVRAIDLNTLRPIPNTQIKVLDRTTGQQVATGSTGKDGFAEIGKDYAFSSGSSLVVCGFSGENHAYGGYNFYTNGPSDTYKTMFYTDRPVYRLGQTVYYKGIIRALNAGALKNPGRSLDLTATVEDPDNNALTVVKLKTNEHGSFNGLFSIPSDGKTGAYQIIFKFPDGTEDYERFEIAEYRKPEYQVEVIPGSVRMIAGNRAKARVRATYYFGAPVTDAKVKYTIFSSIDWGTRYSLMDRPQYYSFFDSWAQGDSEGEGQDASSGGDFQSDGYTVTDSTGEATVEFDTKRSVFDKDKPWDFDRYDHNYRVEAEVTDLSRLSVVGSGSMTVTNGEFALFVSPSSYVAKVGDNVSADIRAISYDGHKALANQAIHVKLYRRIYDRVHYTYRGTETYEDRVVTTDKDGAAHITFGTKAEFPTDTYDILATAEDSFHNTIADESSVWVVSENSPYMMEDSQAKQEPFSVKLDKTVYRIGDTAKVMVVAPVTGTEGGQAIVSIEGPKLYNYKVVDLKATATMVEIPILNEYSPNVYVDVTFIGKKRQFYQQSKMIKVSPQDHFLKLAVDTDKDKYKPGEVATYTIKATTADGKPAPNTEVSLGIVDESIYAIRPDTTPDIRSFFYAERGNSVTTICSFPEDYSGGPNKIEPRIRKDFRDTAAWIPALVTDSNGVAKTTVKLPDNLTTWRATALAINMNTDVGSVRQKVISTQDLILRLALPRFFSQGDEGTITAVVHNFTGTKQNIALTLNIGNEFRISTPLKQTLTVEPDKAQRFNWPVTVLTSGEAKITCKAIGATASDAMQVTLPIRPLGVQSFITKSGVATGDDDSINLAAGMPDDAKPGSGKLHVYLSSSTVGSMVGNFASLIDYPYGCTEQTMSKLMPSVIAVRLSQTMKLPMSPADQAKFKVVYKQSMDKLNGYQHDDGGWGWWATDQSQIYLTALVLDGYKQLRDAGFTVPADRQTNGLNYLQKGCDELCKQLSDLQLMKVKTVIAEKAIDLGRGTYVLTRYNKPITPAIRNWAMLMKDQMTPEPLAYFTLAFSAAGDKEAARAFYNRLVDLSNSVTSDAGATLDWAPSLAMMNKIGRKGDIWYSYRYTDVETTALGLEAVALMEPENQDRMEAIKRWILLQRGKDGWANTKTTSEVLHALLQVELQGQKYNGETDFIASIDGSSVHPLNFTRASATDSEKDLNLAPRAAGYVLHKKGHGRLYYTSVFTYSKMIKPGEFVAQKSQPDGLNIRRDFFRLKPSKPDQGGNVHFSAEPLVDHTVHAGETILMKVYVDMPTDLPYVYLDAPLPSGAEVVQNDSRENAQEAGDANHTQESSYPFGDWWWTHQDVMDDHLAFFITNFNRGKAELHQMIRMEIPGKFQMNPVTLEGMYSKGVRAYSQADEFRVTE